MEELIQLNAPQMASVILSPRSEVDIWGRATGKSFGMGWEMHQIIQNMARSVSAITGATYGQLMTRTLPSTFKLLDQLCYVKNDHYVICTKPPKTFTDPYEKILKYDNFIQFSNGTGFLMLSQDRGGSSRGPSVDRLLGDECLTFNKKRYDDEVIPTNRGNEDRFGFQSLKPLKMHHGFHYMSSMPPTIEGDWLLEQGNYYEEERGIRIFDIWNQIIKLQLDLLDITDPDEFAHLWNEIDRIKEKIAPFVSKDGVLFTLANAFDNIDNVGLRYIREMKATMMPISFMIEGMNWRPDTVERPYYQIDKKHIYFDSYNNTFIRDYAENTDWDWKKLGAPDSRFDLDCDPKARIEIVFDFGSSVTFMMVCQESVLVERNVKTFNYIKEFFVMPAKGKVMIDEIVDDFCKYYYHHEEKTIFYYKDKYGDAKLANSSFTYNDQVMNRLKKNGWIVQIINVRAVEPPHHDKYLFWCNALSDKGGRFPIVRINGNNCKNFIIAAKATMVKEVDNKFSKDKSSENPRSGIDPRKATHSTDAADKIMWIKFNLAFKNVSSSFIAAKY